MEYFLLQQDDAYNNTPEITQIFTRINKKNINQYNHGKLKDAQVFHIKPKKQIDTIDYLQKQLLLVSKKVKEVITLYEPQMVFKDIVLLDGENGQTYSYYLPIFQEIKCIAKSSEWNLDKSVLKKLVLDEKRIPDLSIFKLKDVTTTYIVGRLDIAESLLRRDVEGITFIPIEKEGD